MSHAVVGTPIQAFKIAMAAWSFIFIFKIGIVTIQKSLVIKLFLLLWLLTSLKAKQIKFNTNKSIDINFRIVIIY